MITRFIILLLLLPVTIFCQWNGNNNCIYEYQYAGKPGDYVSDSLQAIPGEVFIIQFCSENVPDKFSVFTAWNDSISFYIGENVTNKEVKDSADFYRGYMECDYNVTIKDGLNITMQDVDVAPPGFPCVTPSTGGMMVLTFAVPNGMCALKFSVAGNTKANTVYWMCINKATNVQGVQSDTVVTKVCEETSPHIVVNNCTTTYYMYDNEEVKVLPKVTQPECLGDFTGKIEFDPPYDIFNLDHLPEAIYNILVYNDYCEKTFTVEIKSEKVCDIYIPNVFNPKSYDYPYFTIYTKIPVEYDLYIYSRWGELLYHNTRSSVNEGWDGRYNGQYVNPGVYVYLVRVDDKQYTGNITVLYND